MTKNSALGVRGTIWETHFDAEKEVTNVETFEGEVALTKINGADLKLGAQQLIKVLNKRIASSKDLSKIYMSLSSTKERR